MDKVKKMQKKGWKVGDVDEFLGLLELMIKMFFALGANKKELMKIFAG